MTVISFNEANRKRQRTLALFKQFYKQHKCYHLPDRKKCERLFLPKRYGVIDNAKPLRVAIAVYPALCMQAARERGNWVHLSLENLAKMTGVSVPTAKKGVDNLTQWVAVKIKKHREREQIISTFPLLEIRHGRRNAYKVGYVKRELVKEWRGNYFAFHTCIIESGVWAKLPPLAKALYLAMLCNAEQHHELYCKVEGVQRLTVEEYYERRKWDVCWTPLTELARQVGYSKNPKKCVSQLVHCGLVERVGRWFKVYLKPKSIR